MNVSVIIRRGLQLSQVVLCWVNYAERGRGGKGVSNKLGHTIARVTIKLGRFMYKSRYFLFTMIQSTVPSPNLQNLPNLTHQIHLAQVTTSIFFFSNSSTPVNLEKYGEYLDLLNSCSSGHCLVTIWIQCEASDTKSLTNNNPSLT